MRRVWMLLLMGMMTTAAGLAAGDGDEEKERPEVATFALG